MSMTNPVEFTETTPAFPAFSITFTFEGEEPETSHLNEAETLLIARLGHTEQARYAAVASEDDDRTVTIGTVNYDNTYPHLITIDGTDYTVDQVAELVSYGLPRIITAGINRVLETERDTQNPAHEV